MVLESGSSEVTWETSDDESLPSQCNLFFVGCDPPAVAVDNKFDTGGPMWAEKPSASENENGMKIAMLLVETFGEVGKEAVSFCNSCAEPVERCNLIHYYTLTKASIKRHKAGIEAVIAGVKKFTKNKVKNNIIDALQREISQPYGVSVVLGKVSRAESGSFKELDTLRCVDEVAKLNPSNIQWVPGDQFQSSETPFWCDTERWKRIRTERLLDNLDVPSDENPTTDSPENVLNFSDDDESLLSWEEALSQSSSKCQFSVSEIQLICLSAAMSSVRITTGLFGFEFPSTGLNVIKKAARDHKIRFFVEWDLTELDESNSTYTGPGPRFEPRTPRWCLTAVRSHQESALNATFPRFENGNSRLRSGVVALPCGAGKTLVGVMTSASLGVPSLVLCTSGVAVEQWVAQYGKWADLHTIEGRVARYTGRVKDKITPSTQIVITTYNMLIARRRSAEATKAVATVLEKQWGIVILDEVHVLPAESCSNVIKGLSSRSFIGLTATLVREDNKIDSLNELIGPRLHEAEWGDLVNVGVLARVKCIEVRCTLSNEFAAEYLRYPSGKLKDFIACLNPSKLQATAAIVNYHEMRGDKTLVFSDSLFVLNQLQSILRKPSVSGATPLKERLQLLSDFQSGRRLNTLIISRVGDCAIDLPAASIIIQVSSHFGSRRQEAQRLGRILRPKGSLVKPVPFVQTSSSERSSSKPPNALFYSVISQDTAEVEYSRRRQLFLEEQGYSYQQVSYNADPPILRTAKERVDLLAKTLTHWQTSQIKDASERKNVEAELQLECLIERSPSPDRPVAERRITNMSMFSCPDPNALIYGEWTLANDINDEQNSPKPAAKNSKKPAAKGKQPAKKASASTSPVPSPSSEDETKPKTRRKPAAKSTKAKKPPRKSSTSTSPLPNVSSDDEVKPGVRRKPAAKSAAKKTPKKPSVSKKPQTSTSTSPQPNIPSADTQPEELQKPAAKSTAVKQSSRRSFPVAQLIDSEVPTAATPNTLTLSPVKGLSSDERRSVFDKFRHNPIRSNNKDTKNKQPPGDDSLPDKRKKPDDDNNNESK